MAKHHRGYESGAEMRPASQTFGFGEARTKKLPLTVNFIHQIPSNQCILINGLPSIEL
jgi:hypothetical protein